MPALLAVGASALAAPCGTAAQEMQTPRPGAAAPVYQASLFYRDRDIPVIERKFAAFEAQGLPLGDLRLYPALGVGLFGTSNVFENNKRREDDGAVRLTPSLAVVYDSSQVTADAYVRGVSDHFVRHGTEDEDQVTVGVDVRRQLPGYSYVFAQGSYGVLALPRIASESPADARDPLRYEDAELAFGGVYERDRVRLTARVDSSGLSYDDGRRLDGSVLQTHDRDRWRVEGTVRAEYALSPATAVYVGASGNRLDYRLDPPHVAVLRDSNGYEVYAGTNFQVTGLTRADVRVGYLDQIFEARGQRDISGVGAQGRLEYFPSRLTTVTVEARRAVESTGVPGTGGFLESGGSVAIDHELRRFIMLNAKASYFDDQYAGISRHDGIVFATLGAWYISSHSWNFKGAYEYYHQNSHGSQSGVNYDDHRVVGTLTFKY